MMLIGVLWGMFAPLSLVAAAAVIYFLLRRLASPMRGAAAFVLASILVVAPVVFLWALDKREYDALCRTEGAATIDEKAPADGFLLLSGSANSFGMRYLQQEGFGWMEARDIFHRDKWVRYERGASGAIRSHPIDAPQARFEVRETDEQRDAMSISRVAIDDSQKIGRELAKAASLIYDGGRVKWLLGAWGLRTCPSAASDPAGFEAFYHLARNTLR